MLFSTPVMVNDTTLDEILYGRDSISLAYIDSTSEIEDVLVEAKTLRDTGKPAEVLALLVKARVDTTRLSLRQCEAIFALVQGMAPRTPCSITEIDITALCPILEAVCRRAAEADKGFTEALCATMLYHCCEHLGRYEEARVILRELIRASEERDDRYSAAVYKNNLAYEDLLEKKWTPAIKSFRRAARLFTRLRMPDDTANSLANMWTCVFERDGVPADNGTRKTIRAILHTLRSDWRRRKPLMLLAKMAEARGKIATAFILAHHAAEAGKFSGTRYYEWDREEVGRLGRIKQ